MLTNLTIHSVPVLISAFLCIYVGFYHITIYFRMGKERVNLMFGLACFSVALYNFSCAGLYNATSFEQGIMWQRGNFVGVGLISIFFLLFIYDYTNRKPDIIIWVITIFFSMSIILVLFVHNELTLSLTKILHKHITIGSFYAITYYEADPGIIPSLELVGSVAGYIYLLYIVINNYRKNRTREDKIIIFSIFFFFFTVVLDISTALGLLTTVYLLEYAFLMIVLSMSNAMMCRFTRLHQTVAMLNASLEEKVMARTEELRESEEKYRQLLENIEDIIYVSDWRGNFKYASPSGIRKLGYTPAEMYSMNYIDLFPPDSREEEFAFYKEQLKKKTSETFHEFKAIKKNGTIIWLEQTVKMVTSPDGEIEFYGIAHEITERKKAELALRSSEEKYRSIIDNISEGYFELDLKGNFVFGNAAMVELSGYTHIEWTEINFRSYMSPETEKRAVEFFKRVLMERAKGALFEYEHIQKDGKKIWISCSISVMNDDSGNTIGFRGISRNITKQREEDAARRDLEEQKSRFFANISHEIRTPLTLMLSPIEAALQHEYNMKLDDEFLNNLYRNGLRLLKLINNLLDFSKIEAGRMGMKVAGVDIVHYITTFMETITTAAQQHDISLSFNTSVEDHEVFIDVEKMDKAVMNVLSNALKYTGSGGSIGINIREDAEKLMISFQDTGPGIPADKIGIVFDRFGQAHTKFLSQMEGTGIGLALAKEFVEMHGGSITVESRFIETNPNDHGTTFTISLPKGKNHFLSRPEVTFIGLEDIDESITGTRSQAFSEIGSLTPGTAGSYETTPRASIMGSDDCLNEILIVDDNPEMVSFIAMLLEKNYRIYTAGNGKQGLEAVDIHRPDLIITDVMMPVMDGYEMTRILKADNELRHIPVIMITAKADISQKIEGLEQGADDYLVKPFNPRELLVRIRTLIKTVEFEKIIMKRNREVENELEIARMLQQRLLPDMALVASGYDMHAVYIPMDKVGGDFYDYKQRDGVIDLFIADVSGHGLPGAFMSTITKMANDHIEDRTSPARILLMLNDVICRTTVMSNFITAFNCNIDMKTNRMKYAIAGHNPPIVYRSSTGDFIRLEARGKLLGFIKGIEIEEKEMQMLAGDRLVLYTDGITECHNPAGEMFGEVRFNAFIKECYGLSPENCCTAIISRLREFSGSFTFEDDLTILIFDVH